MIRVSDIHFSRASELDQLDGLLGFVKFTFADALEIRSVAVRRTQAGRIGVYFPELFDRQNRPHAVVWPTNAEIKRAIEDQILATLRAEGRLP